MKSNFVNIKKFLFFNGGRFFGKKIVKAVLGDTSAKTCATKRILGETQSVASAVALEVVLSTINDCQMLTAEARRKNGWVVRRRSATEIAWACVPSVNNKKTYIAMSPQNKAYNGWETAFVSKITI